jgi:MoaA/NifB/PqqE/SkfB family radical SAM enzyme
MIPQRLHHLILGVRNAALRPATPQDLLLYVSGRCNARCGHCFFRADMDRPGGAGELSLADLEALSSSLVEPLHSLVLTGGEPFLRNDLPDICALFHRRNQVHTVFLPTNGLLTEQILDQVERICSELPLNIYVQISLDGFQAQHDLLRGCPGSFQRAIATAQQLKSLQARFPGLYVSMATTLHTGNLPQLEDLAAFVQQKLGLPHSFEVVRGTQFQGYSALAAGEVVAHSPADPAIQPVPLDELDSLCCRLDAIFQRSSITAAGHSPILAPLIYAYRSTRFWHLRDVLVRQRPFRCPAGGSMGVIYPDGKVAFCEFLPPVGSLPENGYNLREIWNSTAANALRPRLRSCYCTHGCFQAVAMMREWKVYGWLARKALHYTLAALSESGNAWLTRLKSPS